MVMACAPVLSAAPAVPTLDPGAINQIIAQTAEAASTQTAAAVQTSTPTETFTPTPRGTNTPGPTITETIIFVYNIRYYLLVIKLKQAIAYTIKIIKLRILVVK